MRNIRILHVNKLYHPWTGGIEATVQQLAEGCREFPEFETEVLVCQSKGSESFETVNGIAVNRAASLGMAFRMPVSFSYPSRLRSQTELFDIVHVHLPFPLALFGPWKRNPTKTRLIVHFHCDVIRPLQKRIMSLLHPLQRRMLGVADLILVGSQRMIEASPVLKPYRTKCRVLPYAVNSERFVPFNRQTTNSTSTNKRVVLFVGRLVYYKGIEYLIRSMKEVDAQLVIAGDGPLRRSLEELSRKLGLSDRVNFLGPVTDGRLAELYRSAWVLALPSVEPTEAFGLVQVEAMLHGVPVVNTWLSTGVPEVSIDGKTGFTVPPRDIAALADALNAIIDDASLRAQFSENALHRAALYSPSSVLAELRSIYLGVMGISPTDSECHDLISV